MASPDATEDQQLATDAPRVLAQVEALVARGSAAEVSDETAQQLLLAAVRLFAAKRDIGNRLEALPAGSVTATEVAVTAVAMTKVVNLELFELALWNGWSNI